MDGRADGDDDELMPHLTGTANRHRRDDNRTHETTPILREVTPPPAIAALTALAATAILGALVVADGPSALRLPLALVTVLLTPGLAAVGLLRLPPSAARAALMIAISVATSALVSTGLVLLDRLTAGTAVAALLGLCAPPVAAQVVLRRKCERTQIRRCAWRSELARAVAFAPLRRSAILTVLSAACLVVAAVRFDSREATQIGLLTTMPVIWWIGLLALVAGFGLHARSHLRPLLAMAQVGLLIAFLYGLVAFTQPYARVPTSYTHVGLVDYLVRDGGITSYFDARFSWPGSLSTAAMLTQLSGAVSSATFVRWAAPVFVTLWALAVYAIAAAYATRPRVPWITVWLFLSLNWVGQDYWSSQAVNFFLVITVVAAVATWFPRRILRDRRGVLPFEQPPTAFRTSAQGVGLLLCLVLVTAAVAASHQLSPFMLVGFLTVLWLVDRRDIRLLPAVAGLATVMWISWGAEDYWIGHFQRLTQDVGNVTGVITTGTIDRIADGSIARRFVLATRLALTAAVWCAAAAVLLRALRRRHFEQLVPAVLMAVPLGAVALQSYGGELGLRIFLFSLPFTALLLARAIDESRLRWSPAKLAAGLLVVLLTMAAFVTARHGNEQFEQTYPEDVAVTRALAATAHAGSYVLGVNTSNPLRMLPYRSYRLRGVPELAFTDRIPVRDALEGSGANTGYILVFESSILELPLRWGASADWHLELDRQLADLGARELFRDGRAVLYRYWLPSVQPLPNRPRVPSPFVSAATRQLLGWPALGLAGVVAVLLLAMSLLHVAGVRWRAGALDVIALVASVGVAGVMLARFMIFT